MKRLITSALFLLCLVGGLPMAALAATPPTVAGGKTHSCALSSTGGVVCWGSNTYGELGNGTTQASSIPVPVTGLSSNVIAIALGESFSCALVMVTPASLTTEVRCWGWNQSGQLGDGTSQNRQVPVTVSGSLTLGARAITAGQSHTCIVNNGNAAFCWGNHNSGQLGRGTSPGNTAIPGAVTLINGFAQDVSQIQAGGYHTCARRSTGSVYCWGANYYGQLGNSTIPIFPPASAFSNVPVAVTGIGTLTTEIALGFDHSCARYSGGIRCWGNNAFGQLGDGTQINRRTFVSVSGISTGTTALAAGYGSTCAVVNGATKCWGDNTYGQLGDGNFTSSLIPVQVPELSSGIATLTSGYWHGCTLLNSGEVKCWGHNGESQLGNGTMTGSAPFGLATPVNVKSTDGAGNLNLASPQTITFPAIEPQVMGTAPFPIGIVTSSGLDPVINSTTPSVCSVTNMNLLTLLAPGTCTLTADQPGNGTYGAAPQETQSFTVLEAMPVVQINTTQLDFGIQSQGTTSAAQAVTLSNTGTMALTISALSASGDFSASHDCPATLVAGSGCSILVSFSPAAFGPRTGTLSITSDAGGSPHTVSLQGTGQNFTVTTGLVAGWNLLGNGTTGTVNVATVFGDANQVNTVWKWLPGATPGWAFYTPLQADGGAAYAASMGYGFLTTIQGGEGFWVNAKTAFSAALGSGSLYGTALYRDGSAGAGTNPLPPGWSLIAVGDNPSPRAFANGIALTPPAPGTPAGTPLTTLWAWQPGTLAQAAGWLFYAPSLDNSGGLANYISGAGYLDFDALGKTLDAGTGFWVNHP